MADPTYCKIQSTVITIFAGVIYFIALFLVLVFAVSGANLFAQSQHYGDTGTSLLGSFFTFASLYLFIYGGWHVFTTIGDIWLNDIIKLVSFAKRIKISFDKKVEEEKHD